MRQDYDSTSPADMAEWATLPATPDADFRQWLDDEESRLNAAMDHFKLPHVGNLIVADREHQRSWRYLRDGELDEGKRTGNFPIEPTFTSPYATHAWAFLMNFPPHSSFWFYGKWMEYLLACRQALVAGDLLRLAGNAVMLGRTIEAMRIKFGSAAKIEKRERQIEEAANRGNATKREKAEAWRATARGRLSRLHTAPRSISETARAVLDSWPKGQRKPSERTLRDYLAKLAGRDVSPILTE
jgi:hypothetical protein